MGVWSALYQEIDEKGKRVLNENADGTQMLITQYFQLYQSRYPAVFSLWSFQVEFHYTE